MMVKTFSRISMCLYFIFEDIIDSLWFELGYTDKKIE